MAPAIKPSRFHSAMRNRRWQIFTLIGLLLITALSTFCWRYKTYSISQVLGKHWIFTYSANGSFGAEIVRGGTMCVVPTEEPLTITKESDYPFNPLIDLIPGIYFDRTTISLNFSCVFLAIAFLTIQYLFLPKSLPPPRV